MKPIQSNSPSPPEAQIAGIILAGGLSRRLGQPKQMLPYRGGTLLEHAIREAEAVTALTPLVGVLPPGDAVPDPGATRTLIVRRQREGGCSASLAAGLTALPPGIDALVVLPSDPPGLGRDLIRLAVDAWLERRSRALTLRFQGVPGHPLIFAASLLPTLAELRGDKAMWAMLERLGTEVDRVDIDVALPQDVDTWEEYMGVRGTTSPLSTAGSTHHPSHHPAD
jgi:molybdenum cofactor cytidylyltransferase